MPRTPTCAGVPRETAANERRVALSPAGVQTLLKQVRACKVVHVPCMCACRMGCAMRRSLALNPSKHPPPLKTKHTHNFQPHSQGFKSVIVESGAGALSQYPVSRLLPVFWCIVRGIPLYWQPYLRGLLPKYTFYWQPWQVWLASFDTLLLPHWFSNQQDQAYVDAGAKIAPKGEALSQDIVLKVNNSYLRCVFVRAGMCVVGLPPAR